MKFRRPFCVFMAALTAACATPSQRVNAVATAANMAVGETRAGDFSLLTIERRQPPVGRGAIRVYIDGDGRPWAAGGYEESRDPTPRDPLALDWMVQDASSRLYLGRPCYFGRASDAACRSALWTGARYSQVVVDAMVAGLQQWLTRTLGSQPADVTLVGYSGGGVIALMMAEAMPAVSRVVAVATPLDHRVWTDRQGYLPLTASINPAEVSGWRSGVDRVFVFGAADENVPAAVFAPLARGIPGARVVTVPAMAHVCCRATGWSALLERAVGTD